MRGRGRRWASGCMLALLVAVGICAAAAAPQATFGIRAGVVASRPAATADAAAARRLAAVRAVLDRRGNALLRRDRAGWLAGLDAAAVTLRSRQAAFLANIAPVPLHTWRYTVERPDETGRVERNGSWTVRVTLHYALRDVDPVPTERPLVLTFTGRGGRWLISADDRAAPDGTRSWRGPWEHGPLLVRRGSASLVLAHPANAGRLATFAAVADAVVPRVRALVGVAPTRVAVVIPDDQREMAALVGQRLVLGTIAAVAVADAVDAGRGLARGQRIVVNPATLDRLGPLGRRVVLQHEVTHLATRSVTAPGTPIWLVEGLADWVGYSGSGLSAWQVGTELQAALQSGHWPGRLPDAADFRGSSPRLALAYEEAWSACRLVASRAGRAGLLRLYRAIGTAADPAAAVDAQLRRVLGMGAEQFTQLWQRTVRAEFG